MKTFSTMVLVAGALLSTGSAFAQDAASGASGSMMKRGSMQDCRDRANTARGEKRNDTPMNADTDKACADMTKKNAMHQKRMKSGAAASSAM